MVAWSRWIVGMVVIVGCSSETRAPEAGPASSTTSSIVVESDSLSDAPTTVAGSSTTEPSRPKLVATDLVVGRDDLVEVVRGPAGWLAVSFSPLTSKARPDFHRSDDGLAWQTFVPQLGPAAPAGEDGWWIDHVHHDGSTFSLVLTTWTPEGHDRIDEQVTVLESTDGVVWVEAEGLRGISTDGQSVLGNLGDVLLAGHQPLNLLTPEKERALSELFGEWLRNPPASGVCRADMSDSGAGYWSCADTSAERISADSRVSFGHNDLVEPGRWDSFEACARHINSIRGGYDTPMSIISRDRIRDRVQADFLLAAPTLLPSGQVFAIEGDFDAAVARVCDELLPLRAGVAAWWLWDGVDDEPSLQPMPPDVRFRGRGVYLGPVLHENGRIRIGDWQQVWELEPNASSWTSLSAIPSYWDGAAISADGDWLAGVLVDVATDGSIVEVMNVETGELQRIDLSAVAVAKRVWVVATTAEDLWYTSDSGRVFRLPMASLADG